MCSFHEKTEPWAPTEGNIEIHVLCGARVSAKVAKCTPMKVATSARGLENSDRADNNDGTYQEVPAVHQEV